MIQSVCVYCASSSNADSAYLKAASDLGTILAEKNITCYFGAGFSGLMGALASSMIKNNGDIIGVIPQFMHDEGWTHPNLKKVIYTDTMHERKQLMVKNADAAIALPGGCGTMEELLEVITWKQLGIFTKPIVILNTNHYFDPLIDMLNKAVAENFMRPEHVGIWSVVESPEEILPAIEGAVLWTESAIKFAHA